MVLTGSFRRPQTDRPFEPLPATDRPKKKNVCLGVVSSCEMMPDEGEGKHSFGELVSKFCSFFPRSFFCARTNLSQPTTQRNSARLAVATPVLDERRNGRKANFFEPQSLQHRSASARNKEAEEAAAANPTAAKRSRPRA